MMKCESQLYDNGEVLKREYYYYFEQNGFNEEIRIKGQSNSILKYAFYKGSFYYVKSVDGKRYLWKSDASGTQYEVIGQLTDDVYYKEIFVNICGIYLILDHKILLLDFNGNEKAVVKIDNIIESYYICDDKIFTVTRDEYHTAYAASWFDTTNQKLHSIYAVSRLDSGKNSRGERSFSGGCIKHIMANKNRVVMCMGFWNYYYPENDEEFYEVDGYGWYSYDLKTKTMTCLNNCSKYLPHLILSKPQIFMYKSLEEIQNKWVEIAAFDMDKDIMWIKRNAEDGMMVWEPRYIGSMSDQKRVSTLSCWKVNDIREEYKPVSTLRMCWMGDNGQKHIVQERAEITKYKENISKLKSRKKQGGKIDKMAYWQEFVKYAFEEFNNQEFIKAEFPASVPAYRNWYALRLGTSKVYIELSFNTQKGTMRTALLIKDKNLFADLERLIESQNCMPDVIYNKESKTTSISVMRNGVDLSQNREEQFEWFMENACMLKRLFEFCR